MVDNIENEQTGVITFISENDTGRKGRPVGP